MTARLARLAALALCLAPLSPAPLWAEGQSQPATDDPLSAQAFERFVEGRTLDAWNDTGRYGVETFLPDRRTLWEEGGTCLDGRWFPQDGLICFDYDGVEDIYCWSYHDRGGWLMSWQDGNRANPPVRLLPSTGPMACETLSGV